MAFPTIHSKLPLIIILGATGTGKTKLGIELAKRFGTEIISADSMQIYKGLDIVTAKASVQDRQLVPHHLLDILNPHQTFTVVDFKSRAIQIIDHLSKQDKIPIIVGGTNYYIESIVYKILIQESNDCEYLLWHKSKKRKNFDDEQCEGQCKIIKSDKSDVVANLNENRFKDNTSNKETCIDRNQIQKDYENNMAFSNLEIHEKLKAIDPIMAGRLHPNDRRKVLRAIQVWLQMGRRCSEILDEQKLTEGQLRFSDATVVLWLKCEKSVLDRRLDDRVDSMIEDGLIDELLDFHKKYNIERFNEGEPPDYTTGIFQSLGFKEFHEYLMLSDEIRNKNESTKLLAQSIELMKTRTRRYARNQNKFVETRFLNHRNRETPPIFELDTSDLLQWDDRVKNRAINIIESYTKGEPCEYTPLKSNKSHKNVDANIHSSNYCYICERVIIGDRTYSTHLNSNKHAKMATRKKKLTAANEDSVK